LSLTSTDESRASEVVSRAEYRTATDVFLVDGDADVIDERLLGGLLSPVAARRSTESTIEIRTRAPASTSADRFGVARADSKRN
jgi:hypothetical protein